MPDWKSCEGELLDGKYPLERHIGGDEESAVFLIGFASAAVRIRRADAAEAAALVERWHRAQLLSHPHLLEIDAAGTATLRGEPVAYVVMEHAEENLGEILRERPLTADETREMLVQVADALEYLHRRGLAHGELNAGNIVALGDSVKLSSDSIGEGDRAADIRALGLTLVHALTGRPESVVELPAPFGEIAKGCLEPDPARRWTADRILARLRAPRGVEAGAPGLPAQAGKAAAARPRARRIAAPVGLLAAGLAIAAIVMVRRTEAPPPAVNEPRVSAAPAAPEPAPPAPTPAPKTSAPAAPDNKAESTRDRLAIEDGIAHRVTPDVPAKARQTIDGRPAVVVRVTVDAAGDVTEAKVERTFSPYFSKIAADAARRWKFVPEERAGSREWLLRFVFTRGDTRVEARRVAPE